MPIQVVATLTPNLNQTIADLQPGDMLLVCLAGTWEQQPEMPGSMLSIGETYTAVTPPPLTEMDHPREGTTEYPHHWQPWVMWAAYTGDDWSEQYAYVCPWIVTGFTGGPHTISINYPGQLLWGKVIRGVDPVKWGHRYVRAAEISQGTNGQISYNDFPHTVNIDSDDALVLHVFYPQTEYDPTIAPTQPEDYGPQIYALTGNESAAPSLYHLRTIPPAATSFTMSQPNMILGDPRFFPSAVEVWYIIFYGGASEPPDETGDQATFVTQIGAQITTNNTGGSTGGVGEDGAAATRITQVAALIASLDDGNLNDNDRTLVTQVAAHIESLNDGDNTGDPDDDARTRVTQVAALISSEEGIGQTGNAGEDGLDASRVTQVAALLVTDDTGGSTDGVGEDGAAASRVTQVAALLTTDDTGGSTGGVGEDGAAASRVTQVAALLTTDDTGGSTGGVGEDGAAASRVTQVAALFITDDTGGSTGGVGEDGAAAIRLTQVGFYIVATEIEIQPAPGSTIPITEGEETTWARYWQLSAEGQSVADVVRYGTGAFPVISGDKKFTGGYSYRNSAAVAVHENAAFGFALPPGQTVRCNLLINHNGVAPSPITEAAVVDVLKLDCAGTIIAVQWNSTKNTFELRAGFEPGTARPRYPIARVTAGAFNQVDTWHSIGLTAKIAAEGGFVSLYLNQMRMLTWVGDTRIYASNSNTPITTITGLYATGSPENSDQYGGWAAWCNIDDFYADAGDGSEQDLPAPFLRFFPRFRRPGAADIKAEMTVVGAPTNGEAIDDAPPDDDDSYVGATGPQQDIYRLADAVLEQGWTPTAQIAIGYARQVADLDYAIIMSMAQANGQTLDGAAAPLALTYGYVGNRFIADADAEPWTIQAINATHLSVAADGEF